MFFRSLGYGLLITLLSGCLQTTIEQPTVGSLQLSDATPWRASGKILVSTKSQRQTLRFTWSHVSIKQDRIELSDTLGLRSVTLVKDSNKYYLESDEGQRTLLSANTLEEPLAGVLSSLPNDIAQLLTGAVSSNSQVISEVVSWSTSARFATPEVLRISFGDYSLKIMINQWNIGSRE